MRNSKVLLLGLTSLVTVLSAPGYSQSFPPSAPPSQAAALPLPPIPARTGWGQPYDPRKPNQGPVPKNYPGGWVTTNDYPSFELRREIQGKVKFDLFIDKTGLVTACAVTHSSGSQRLDEDTCRHVRRRAQYFPATNSASEPVSGQHTKTVLWRIPDTPEPLGQAPTPAASPAHWIINNPLAVAPPLPKIRGAAIVETAAQFDLIVGVSGRVESCQFKGFSRWAYPTRPPDQKAQNTVCDQYRANGHFLPATLPGGYPTIGTFHAYVPAKVISLPAK